MATGTLNTNSAGDTTAEQTITSQKTATLFVLAKTGTHHNHRVILQVSPNDGTNWVDTHVEVLGTGCKSSDNMAVTRVRAKVLEAEGSTSTVDVHVLVR